MTKQSQKELLESLKSRFPRLADRIDRSAEAIEDAYKIVKRSTAATFKRDRRTLTTMAESGALPGAVAKFFISQLVDPPQKKPRKYELVYLAAERYCDRIARGEISQEDAARDIFRDYGFQYPDMTLDDVRKIITKVCEEIPKIRVLGMPRKITVTGMPTVPSPPSATAPPQKTCPHCNEPYERLVKDKEGNLRCPNPECLKVIVTAPSPVAPPPAALPPTPTSVTVKVTDKFTGKPLPGVMVALYAPPHKPLEGKSGTTDNKGECNIANVVAGKYFVEASGYGASATKAFEIAAGESREINIELEATPFVAVPAGFPAVVPTKAAKMPFHVWRHFDPLTAAAHEARRRMAGEAQKFLEEYHTKHVEPLRKRLGYLTEQVERAEKERKSATKAEDIRGWETLIADYEKERDRVNKELAGLDPEKALKDHMKEFAKGLVTPLKERYKLVSITDLERVLEAEGGSAALAALGKAPWYHKAAAYAIGAAGMSAGNISRAIIVDWWGAWGAAIAALAFGFPVALILLFIWGGWRVPPLFSAGIVWFQIAFLAGGSVFMAAPLPGYTAFSTGTIIFYGVLGALVNLLLNIKKQPGFLPTLSHIMGGAAIALSATMLVLALQAFGAGGIVFTLLVIFAIGVAAFQIYPNVGLHGINVIAIIILVFGYFALGPYSGPVVQAVDQIKAPIVAAQFAASNAMSDIWLLVTNPNEYYARQQLKAARPEKPISYPSAVEFSRLDAVPEGTVPANSSFVIFAIVENQGDLEAREVNISAECVESVPAGVPKCEGGPHSVGPKTLIPGDALRADFTFTAKGREEAKRAAETVFNKVNVTLSYKLDTSSSLQVEVATADEIMRRMREKTGRFFYREVAIAKVGAAEIGISVGPQPIYADGKQKTLLLSIRNTRPDGTIVLDTAQLKIALSQVVGSSLKCDAGGGPQEQFEFTSCSNAQDGTCTITIKKARIRPYEYRDILPILCSFTSAQLAEGSKTGLITAELTGYTFSMIKEKSIPVGTPLGVLPIKSPSE